MPRKSKDSSGPSRDPRRHTPVFRGSFVHLARPDRVNDDADPRYSLVVVLDVENDDEHAAFLDNLEEWIDEVAEERWGEIPKRLKSPIREGADISDDDYMADKVCFSASSQETRKPGLVYDDLEPIDPQDQTQELYSGAWYRCTIKPWAWEHKTGGKGVSISLDNVMKVDDDEPLGGGSAPDAEDDFSDMKSAGRNKVRRKGRR